MKKDYLAQAIQALSPNCEFVIYNDDYETIEWIVLEGKAPTWQQVQAKMVELENAEEVTKKEISLKKKALLDRLGLTEDEARILLG